MFTVSAEIIAQIVTRAQREYPLEMCGLVAGPPASAGGPGDVGSIFYGCRNTEESARVFTVHPLDHLAAEDDADDRGWEINAVVHSHTHSEPYPSPTDVASAVDADWHYVIVGLRRSDPEVRSYRIVDGEVSPEPLVVD
ncbi:MAG: M67 family metallopeptidase [Actinomycetota bacterium]